MMKFNSYLQPFSGSLRNTETLKKIVKIRRKCETESHSSLLKLGRII